MSIKHSKIGQPGGNIFTRLMDGSIFFRAFSACLTFLGQVASGSYIAGLVIGDYKSEAIASSRFVSGAHYIFNRLGSLCPKNKHLPRFITKMVNGSRILKGLLEMLDIPYMHPHLFSVEDGNGYANKQGTIKENFLKGICLPLIGWLIYAAPVVGLLAVFALAPFLPTMVLAAGLAAAVTVSFLTRPYVLDLCGVFVVFFLIVTLMLGFTSFSPSASLPIALLTSIFMFSYILVTACLRNRRQIDFFYFVFVASSLAAGLVGLYQYILRISNIAWLDTELFGDIRFRVFSTFANPNVYGTYLLIAIPICISLFFYIKKSTYKICLVVITAVLLINLLLTYSRGAYLALGVSAVIFVMLTEKRLIALLPVGGAAVLYALPASMLNRLLSVANFSESSTSYRISIWQGSLRVIKDFWATGIGQGQVAFNSVYPIYSFHASEAYHSHNIFLQVMIETGIVGFLVFLGIMACFIRTMVCCHRIAKGRDRVMAAGIIAATTGMLFMGIFDHIFYNHRVLLIYFIFMGLGSAFARAVTHQEGANERTPCDN